MTFKEITDFLVDKLGTISQENTAHKVICLIIMVSYSVLILLSLTLSGCTIQDGQGHTSLITVVPPDSIDFGNMELSTSEKPQENQSNTVPDM